MNKLLFFAMAVAVFMGGCSSQIVHSEISNDLSAGSVVDGIPYRTPKPLMAFIYEKGANGYTKLAQVPVTIPDPDRLYVLGFRSEPLSTSTLDLIINENNTLQQVSLKSASNGAAALTAAGTQIGAVSAAEQTRVKTGQDAETKAAGLAVAADKTKQKADLAALQYQSLLGNASASAEQLLTAAQNERSAKLDANEAARLAGKPLYFPDVIP